MAHVNGHPVSVAIIPPQTPEPQEDEKEEKGGIQQEEVSED